MSMEDFDSFMKNNTLLMHVCQKYAITFEFQTILNNL